MIYNIFLRPISRYIFQLALPVVLSMISVTAIMVADTAMVGRLGTDALAATGSAGMAYWTFSAFFMGASYGVQALVARRFGEKNFIEIRKIATTSTIFVLCTSLFTFFMIYLFADGILSFFTDSKQIQSLGSDYLQYRNLGTVFFFIHFNLRGFFDGLGKTYVGMIASVSMAVINIILNYLFIFGHGPIPAMGVKGAGLASALSVVVSLIVYIVMFFHPQIARILHGVGYRFQWRTLRDMLKLGFPASINEGVQNTGFLVFMHIAGMIGGVSLDVSNVMFSILALSFMPGYGFSVAATTIMGQSIGQDKLNKGFLGAVRSFQFGAIFMGSMGILFILGGKNLIGLFTTSHEVIETAYIPLIIISLVQVADAGHMIFAGALRGAGLMKWTLGAYTIATWLVMLPIAYFLAIIIGWHTAGLWIGMAVWMIFLAIITSQKFLGRKWQVMSL